MELTGFEPVAPFVAKDAVKTLSPGETARVSRSVARLWDERRETS